MNSEWRWNEENEVRWESSTLLDEVPGIRHGFVSARDLTGHLRDAGGAIGATATQASWREQVAGAVLGKAGSPVLLHQVHGDQVLELDAERCAAAEDDPRPQADGWWARQGPAVPALSIRTADCVPLLLATQTGSHLMAIHAGWRGVAASIVPKAIRALEAAERVAPARWLVAIGPAISSPSYEVGEEVVAGLRRAGAGDSARWLDTRGARPHVDLRQAIAGQLEQVGVPAFQVHLNPRCTFLDAADSFSYRRQGAKAGRLIALIGWS